MRAHPLNLAKCLLYLTFCPLYSTYAGNEGGLRLSTERLKNRLRVARAERALSQEQLAALAGVTRQTISSIENEQYTPSALLAFVLARRLDKPVGEVFYIEGDAE